MENQYAFASHMAKLYGLLVDQRSRELFWARLRYDFEKNLANEARLFQLTGEATEEEIQFRLNLKDTFKRLEQEGKKVILYGTNIAARELTALILEESDFWGYCGRDFEKYKDGLLGKPVISPESVFEDPDEYYVIVASLAAQAELMQILKEHHFPEDHILPYWKPSTFHKLEERQYFDFPELFPKGTAFVDAGCYDCGTSKRFAAWCGGDYSEIIAFEPDPKNFQKCKISWGGGSDLRMKLIPACLSSQPGMVTFAALGAGGSFMADSQADAQTHEFNDKSGRMVDVETTVPATTLDEAVGDTKVGFIKMDIEGAELSALCGAKETIVRDKPLLAICVYHRVGDILAIMDHLHELIPQYRFWIRQYGPMGTETVLYASVR